MPIVDTNSFINAGITPQGKALKYGNAIDQNGKPVTPNPLKYNLKYDDLFDIMSKQNMVETLERYKWINVPFGLTADIIERILFYRGKGVLYFNDKVDKFQFLPFALNGAIDEYIVKQIKKLPKTKLKSKSISKNIVELTFELELKDNETKVLDTFKNIDGVESVSVISYQNDFGA